jgi:hypothetical protein
VLVPQGKLVGGTLQIDPDLLARRPNRLRHELGTAFARNNAPPPVRFSAMPTSPDDGRLHQSGEARRGRVGTARQLLERAFGSSSPGGRIQWSTEGAPPTPFLRTEGLVSAAASLTGPRGYLSIRTNADPR